MAGDWSADPLTDTTATEPETCCPDGTCVLCQVKEVGARLIVGFSGAYSYDDLDPVTAHHFRELAGAVMADMSEAALALGLARDTRSTHGPE